MFESIINFFKKFGKQEVENEKSKDTAKERLHLVLMQDRANVSADFLEMMKQEIIDVIKKYIDVDEGEIDVKLTNKTNDDGTSGAPVLYANIPIVSIKNKLDDTKKEKSISSNANKESTQEEMKNQDNITNKEEVNTNKDVKNFKNGDDEQNINIQDDEFENEKETNMNINEIKLEEDNEINKKEDNIKNKEENKDINNVKKTKTKNSTSKKCKSNKKNSN